MELVDTESVEMRAIFESLLLTFAKILHDMKNV